RGGPRSVAVLGGAAVGRARGARSGEEAREVADTLRLAEQTRERVITHIARLEKDLREMRGVRQKLSRAINQMRDGGRRGRKG
ncbi:MAG: hypothetical protein ACRDHY_11390, partial [Anaerolineales bacterium]